MSDVFWPSFLNLMDSDPQQARDEFCRFALDFLKGKPPRRMRSLPKEDQDDIIDAIVLHFIEDDFRILRRFKRGRSTFESWFYIISYRKVIDYIRAFRRKHDKEKDMEVPEDIPNPGPPLDRIVEMRETQAKVLKAFEALNEECRLLLLMASDEFTLKEMTAVLRLRDDKSKAVADKLRYCRKKLWDILSEWGIDEDSLPWV